MNRKRKLAIGLLILTALGGLAVAMQMLTRQEDAPPAALPVTIVVCAIGSLMAAVGLSRNESWAIPLGVGSRAVEALSAAPGIFAAPNGPAKASAALDLGLSAAAILLLLALRRRALAEPKASQDEIRSANMVV